MSLLHAGHPFQLMRAESKYPSERGPPVRAIALLRTDWPDPGGNRPKARPRISARTRRGSCIPQGGAAPRPTVSGTRTSSIRFPRWPIRATRPGPPCPGQRHRLCGARRPGGFPVTGDRGAGFLKLVLQVDEHPLDVCGHVTSNLHSLAGGPVKRGRVGTFTATNWSGLQWGTCTPSAGG